MIPLSEIPCVVGAGPYPPVVLAVPVDAAHPSLYGVAVSRLPRGTKLDALEFVDDGGFLFRVDGRKHASKGFALVEVPRIPWSLRKPTWDALPPALAAVHAAERIRRLDVEMIDAHDEIVAMREIVERDRNLRAGDRLETVPEPADDELTAIEAEAAGIDVSIAPSTSPSRETRRSPTRARLLDVVRALPPGSTTREIAAEFGGTENAVGANLIALRKQGRVRNSVPPRFGVMSTWESADLPPAVSVAPSTASEAVASNPRTEDAVLRILSADPEVAVTTEELAGDLDRHHDHVLASCEALLRAGKVQRVLRGRADSPPAWQVLAPGALDALLREPETWVVDEFNNPTSVSAGDPDRPGMTRKGERASNPRKILALLRTEGELDTNEIARRCGFSRHLAGTTLARMKNLGDVEIVGPAVGRKLRTWKLKG